MKSIDLRGLSKKDVEKNIDSFFWEMMKKNITYFEILIDEEVELKKLTDLVEEYGFEIDEISDESITIFND